MNIHALRQAQVKFENQIDHIKERREQIHKQRDEFVKYFNPTYIPKMKIDEYVLGMKPSKSGHNFCHGLERKLSPLGRIVGATSLKFGLYYGKKNPDLERKFRFSSIFGDNKEEVFESIKQTISDLIKSGSKYDLAALASNKISPMFKGKILSTYFPDRYLNVFSEDHLNYFLIKLDIDEPGLSKKHAVFKRERLVEFKNNDVVMKGWTLDLFSVFLYDFYPGRPPRDKATQVYSDDPLADYREVIFPSNQQGVFINQFSRKPKDTRRKVSLARTPRAKPNYEQQAKHWKALGDRGEKIVMDMERKRLQEEGRPDLALSVERLSLKSDSYGYDILSFELDGSRRHIEVKATSSSPGSANFYLTENELNKACALENYFIYMVFDVTVKTPKVWIIPNPFVPEQEEVIMKPIKYLVTIDAG